MRAKSNRRWSTNITRFYSPFLRRSSPDGHTKSKKLCKQFFLEDKTGNKRMILYYLPQLRDNSFLNEELIQINFERKYYNDFHEKSNVVDE